MANGLFFASKLEFEYLLSFVVIYDELNSGLKRCIDDIYTFPFCVLNCQLGKEHLHVKKNVSAVIELSHLNRQVDMKLMTLATVYLEGFCLLH